MLAEVADDEGTAMRLCAVLGASAALATHLARHPEHWRELTDPTLGTTRPAAYAVREALLRAVGADPHDPAPVAGLPDAEAVDALRVEYRRILLRLAVARPGPPPRRRRRGGGDRRPRRRHPGGRPGRGPGPGRGERRHGPARRGRDGQVRRPRAQLRLRRGRRLRLRAGRRGRRVAGPARGHPARLPPDAGLLRPHRRGHDLARRRQPPARGLVRAAGAHPGQPPRLLREVGQDLGVPGAAQGPTGRRRPRAGARRTSR